MRWKLICVLQLFFLSYPGEAQNLVPNYSFEEITDCPNDRGQVSFAYPWYPSNGKSTDLINSCDQTGVAGVPDNKWGSQFPYSGNGMAGVRVYLKGAEIEPDYREYLAVRLSAPLKKGERYFVGFKASPGEQSRYYSENIYLHLSEQRIPSSPFLDLKPTISNRQGLLNAFNAWYDISDEYEAKGGERHLVIGNFLNDAETRLVEQFQPQDKDESAYYFIDQVVVQSCTSLWPNRLISNQNNNICPGQELVLTAALPDGDEYSYYWQDSIFSETLSVNQPGDYTLTATFNGVCAITDTIRIESEVEPPDLGPDTLLCPGERLEFELPSDSGTTYLWNDGSRYNSKTIESSGTYWVQSKNGECSLTDTLKVNSILTAELPEDQDTIICEGGMIKLNADQGEGNYLWNTGATTPEINVSEGGLYRVSIENSCYNENLQFFIVEKNCECTAKIPNIFTPNGDGINDSWKVKTPRDVVIEELQIYNRWGRKIYGSKEFQREGRSLWESKVPAGTYFYNLQIGCYNNQGVPVKREFKGNLTVMY